MEVLEVSEIDGAPYAILTIPGPPVLFFSIPVVLPALQQGKDVGVVIAYDPVICLN